MDLAAVGGMASACTRCALAGTRTQAVFADGNPGARLVVVGEAPGAEEDRTGLPFVGRAGRLLDLMLASVGLSRADSVYICNVLKCRPPGNRDPLPAEIEACSPFLRRQLELVRPEVLLAVGAFSAKLLTGTESPIGKLRGEVHAYQGIPLVVTYHPAALLRNPRWNRAAWSDLQLLRGVLT
ncbi:MAG: uracil-DNA glycosylase [Longimicrobiales bacterium]|nr:uracil-DNA glycosylase [Longimicrobiales bacterium]